MAKTIREQELDLCDTILAALTELRKTTRERADGIALDFQLSRKGLQGKIVHERRDKGHPNMASRGVYTPLNLSPAKPDQPFSLRWFTQHYSTHGARYFKPINKGRNTFRYSMGTLMPHVPFWGRDLVKHTEQRASLVRERWASLTAAIWAVRTLRRWITSTDGLATECELDFPAPRPVDANASPGSGGSVTEPLSPDSTPWRRASIAPEPRGWTSAEAPPAACGSDDSNVNLGSGIDTQRLSPEGVPWRHARIAPEPRDWPKAACPPAAADPDDSSASPGNGGAGT